MPRDAIVEKFSADLGRSVVRVPLAERRKDARIDSLGGAGQRAARAAEPIRVEITERTPVAFLRTANDLSLVDAHGVILERPVEGDFHFPVVTGIAESMPPAIARAAHEASSSQFMKEIDLAQPGAERSGQRSGSFRRFRRARDAYRTGSSDSDSASPILVHFGDSDFGNRYQLLTENIGQWRASAGQRRVGGSAISHGRWW